MTEFIGAIAQNYDKNILKVVPGYELVHNLTAAYLLAFLPDHAKILLVGAGTCKEIEVLAKLNSTWQFYAQDISSDMLELAKTKLDSATLARTSFFNSSVNELPTIKFDAVLSIFVLHFVEDINAKADFLSQIRKRLKPDASLLLADLMDTPIELAQNILGQQYKLIGMGDSGIQRSLENQRTEFYPLLETKFVDLAKSTGFNQIQKYFQAIEFCAYILK